MISNMIGSRILSPQKQQLRRLGALQERSVASGAAVAASGSVAGAFQRPGSNRRSVQERCRSDAEQQLQRPRVLQGCFRCKGAAVAAPRSVAGGVDLSIKWTDCKWNRSLCGQGRCVGKVVYPEQVTGSCNMNV